MGQGVSVAEAGVFERGQRPSGSDTGANARERAISLKGNFGLTHCRPRTHHVDTAAASARQILTGGLGFVGLFVVSLTHNRDRPAPILHSYRPSPLEGRASFAPAGDEAVSVTAAAVAFD